MSAEVRQVGRVPITGDVVPGLLSSTTAGTALFGKTGLRTARRVEKKLRRYGVREESPKRETGGGSIIWR